MANGSTTTTTTPQINFADPKAVAAAIKAASTGTGGPSYIGLPGAPGTSGTLTTAGTSLAQQVVANVPAGQIAPRYTSGAEWLPIMQSATPQDIADLQNRMANVGLLSSNYVKGMWDKPSQDAFSYLLGMSNNAGTDFNTTLGNLEANPTIMTMDPKTGLPVEKKKGASALSLTVTNPDDIASTAQNVALQSLGRPLTDAELSKFQNTWQGMQKDFQTTDAQTKAVGGTVTAMPSMQTEEQKFMASADPTAYQGQQAVGLVQHLNGLLSGISGLSDIKQYTPSELGVK